VRAVVELAGPSLRLQDRGRGDLVRRADGRVFELSWPMWPFGTKKADQKRTPIDGWFAREVLAGGVKDRDETWLPVATALLEVLLEKHPAGELAGEDGAGQRGGDVDPLTNPWRGKLL
jgi:hypothetical protein